MSILWKFIDTNETKDDQREIYKKYCISCVNYEYKYRGEKCSRFANSRTKYLVEVEAIKSVIGDNSKVGFIAAEAEKTTLMCDSLNNQEFYINKENVFDRYYQENQNRLRLQRIRCNGLVVGLNLPTIQYHFHYCCLTITYQVNLSKTEVDNLMNQFIYRDITREWENKKIHINKTFKNQNLVMGGDVNKYEVDGHNIVLDYTKDEKVMKN